MAVGFSFLGLTLVAIIMFAVYAMKSRSNNSVPVVLSNYRTLKREDDKNMGVNEILSQYHELHNEDHVTQELNVISADCQGSETKAKIDVDNTITTDCTKKESKTNENQTRLADSSDHNKEEKDTSRDDDEKLTTDKSHYKTINEADKSPYETINEADKSYNEKFNEADKSHYETINEAKLVSESLNRVYAGILKEDVIQESSSSLGLKKSSKTNLNVYTDSPILNSEEEDDMANQKTLTENSSQSINKSIRTSQEQQSNEGTGVISEKHNREEAD